MSVSSTTFLALLSALLIVVVPLKTVTVWVLLLFKYALSAVPSYLYSLPVVSDTSAALVSFSTAAVE